MNLPVLLAQILPNGSDGIDYTTAIQNFADDFTDRHAGLFVPQGDHWTGGFFFIMLAYIMGSQLLTNLSTGRSGLDVWPVIKLVFRFGVVHLAIIYWDRPIFGGDVPVHRIIAHVMTSISAEIDMTIVDEFNLMLHHVRGALVQPGPLNVLGGLAFYVFQGMMGALQGCTFLVTAASYPLLSIGYLVGPLALSFFMLPWLSWIGSGLIRFLLIYSFARVAGNGLVWIWCHMLAWLFAQAFGAGDTPIALGTMLWWSPVIGMLLFGFFYSLLQVYQIGRDIFHGTASMGSALAGMGGANASMQRLVIAFS